MGAKTIFLTFQADEDGNFSTTTTQSDGGTIYEVLNGPDVGAPAGVFAVEFTTPFARCLYAAPSLEHSGLETIADEVRQGNIGLDGSPRGNAVAFFGYISEGALVQPAAGSVVRFVAVVVLPEST